MHIKQVILTFLAMPEIPLLKGGGTICYISFNIRVRFLRQLVLDAFCYKNTENSFKKFENLFWTPPENLEKKTL